MSTTDNFTTYQQKWEQLSEWGAKNPEEWAKNELSNNESLLEGIEAEQQARLAAQNWSASASNVSRIQKLEETAQTVRNRIAWCKGEYEYDGGEKVKVEEDESELELVVESDSDMEDVEMGGGA